MPKKGVRVRVSGKQRPRIDVEAVAQIIIALGRELDGRDRDKQATAFARTEAVSP